jgi:hypothetical protein
MRNEALATLVVLLLAASGVAGYLIGSENPRTTVATTTSTVTNTVLSQYPVTFLGPPKGCVVEAFCVNATLVNHLGSNISVLMSAWIRNATTGQNVTFNDGGRNSIAYSLCTIDTRRPSVCLLVAYPTSGGRGPFEVTLALLGLDGKTVISPAVTAIVKD